MRYDLSGPQQPLFTEAPVCPKCRNAGYRDDVSADRALSPFVDDVMRRAVACSCRAGMRFAEQQAEWLEPDLIASEHQAPREGHALRLEARPFDGSRTHEIFRRVCECGWTGQWATTTETAASLA